jgi:hypothetical protein
MPASALTDLSGRWIDQVAPHRSRGRIVLDMDSSVSPTHGYQEKSVWNGHFSRTCYHPLFAFNQCGDLERCCKKLIKIGAKVVSHGRYVAFQKAAVAITADSYGNMSTPETVYAGKTTGNLRTSVQPIGFFGARLRMSPSLTHQTEYETRRTSHGGAPQAGHPAFWSKKACPYGEYPLGHTDLRVCESE